MGKRQKFNLRNQQTNKSNKKNLQTNKMKLIVLATSTLYLTSAAPARSTNEQLQAVLIKNANLFGMEKKEAMKNWKNSETEIMNLINTIDIASIETYLNTDVGSLSAEVEEQIVAELNPVLQENEEWVSIAEDLWAAFSKTESGQALNAKIDEAGEALSANEEKTLTEIAKEVADYINDQYDVEGQVNGLQAEAEAVLDDF